MKAVVEIELIRLIIHNNDGKIAEAIESAFMRTLARRLFTALNPVVDRQQSAFLPGRHIGDGILGMQLLPRALAAERSSAVAVFCDFRKAYDIVDRDFLLRLMAALGVPAAFRRVLKRLLDRTRAAASVNGVLSAWHYFLAGLRQGCQLAASLPLHRPGTHPLPLGSRPGRNGGRHAHGRLPVC